ncbi:hypothetical protein Tco_1524921 [Tanacetum coccineum]
MNEHVGQKSLVHKMTKFQMAKRWCFVDDLQNVKITMSEYSSRNKAQPREIKGSLQHIQQEESHENEFEGVTDWYQSQGYREPVTMSSATSAVTYTSVNRYETRQSFLGADYEDEFGREAFHGCLPVPQNEDVRDEDEHEFLAKEQPLPRHVTESDPEEDPEEYEDDETEDGPADYPIDGGDGGDDDDGDSSRDDANDEDEDEEDEEDEEEEEHLAPDDSTTVIPVDEPVFPPEGTEPVIPPPSNVITIGARITVRPQTSISLPLEAEVERLLTMTTPSPSPHIPLSPPSSGERLARCTTPHTHSPPLPPPSGCPIQIQTLRIASTQALIDAVTAVLPSPSLPPLPPTPYHIIPLLLTV